MCPYYFTLGSVSNKGRADQYSVIPVARSKLALAHGMSEFKPVPTGLMDEITVAQNATRWQARQSSLTQPPRGNTLPSPPHHPATTIPFPTPPSQLTFTQPSLHTTSASPAPLLINPTTTPGALRNGLCPAPHLSTVTSTPAALAVSSIASCTGSSRALSASHTR